MNNITLKTGFLFSKFGKAIGIRLWKWNQTLIELWYIPKGFKIPKHSHPKEEILLFHIFGDVEFHRQSPLTLIDEFLEAKPFHVYHIPKGWYHWFVTNTKLIFINISTWDKNINPTTTAKDFNYE